MTLTGSVGALRSALNAGGRMMGRAGTALLQLDERTLVADARRRTRLESLDEDDALRAGLPRLLRSLEEEAGLSPVGRLAARKDLTRLLANRLRLVEDRRRHPEIAEQRIDRPIFVTGLPRTGTTLLHGLLAQDPAHRAPLHWEMIHPSPPPNPDRPDARSASAARQLRWFHRLQPALRPIHPVGSELPEECLIITSHSFESFQFQTTHHVPSYEAWLERSDLRPSYTWHRRFLQQLQARSPRRRWVLKAPAHVFGLPALFATYPDALVVFTHRDPLQVSPSLASLTTVLRRTFSDTVDPKAVGQEMSIRWADGIMRALRDRDAGCGPADHFADVRYAELVRDPVGVVRRLYAHWDMPFTAAAENRMHRFLRENPKDRYGRHVYSLEQFGLDVDEERRRYRAYCERVGL